MDSFTKVKLDEAQLLTLLRAAFGPDTVLVRCTELSGGFFNTGYDLELEGGRSVILKVAPAQETEILSYERDIMRAEIEALQLVQAQTDVPVPTVYCYDDTLSLIPSPYFFMEKIDGSPYSDVKESLTPEQRSSIERELGAYQRRFNAIKGPSFGLFVKPDEGKSWREVFTGLLEDLLSDAQRLSAQLPAPAAEIRQEAERYLPALDAVTEPSLVHWDLWNGNVFVKEGRITAVIDWERALWGDVLLEYYFRHFEDSPAFKEGYGTPFDSPGELSRIKLYDLYLDLILVIECYSRQYKDENQWRWTRENLASTWASFKE